MEKRKTVLAGLILAGGKNSRMNGIRKFFLDYEGKTFGERIYGTLRKNDSIEKVYLSVDKEEPYKNLGIELIKDEYEYIGPMGGLYSSLKYVSSDAVLAVACDMPFITEDVVGSLVKTFEKENKTVIVRTDERLQPLLAIYRKNMLKYFRKMIEKKCYKLVSAVEEAYKDGEVYILDLEHERKAVENINTEDRYNKL